jgi:UDP-glucose 6-dehydrogenase
MECRTKEQVVRDGVSGVSRVGRMTVGAMASIRFDLLGVDNDPRKIEKLQPDTMPFGVASMGRLS